MAKLTMGGVLHRLVEIVHIQLSDKRLEIRMLEVPGEGREGGREGGTGE
jgi:hypothetical protein